MSNKANKENINQLVEELTKKLTTVGLNQAFIASDISLAIISKREELGLSQAQLAEKLGKTQSMISKWENGDCNFTLETIVEISLKLSIDIGRIISKYTAPTETNIHTPDSNVISFPAKFHYSTSEGRTQSYRYAQSVLLNM